MKIKQEITFHFQTYFKSIRKKVDFVIDSRNV